MNIKVQAALNCPKCLKGARELTWHRHDNEDAYTVTAACCGGFWIVARIYGEALREELYTQQKADPP